MSAAALRIAKIDYSNTHFFFLFCPTQLSITAFLQPQVLHSSAALLRIADMEYSGTNSFFIQVLLNKKYALPYRVVSLLSLLPGGCSESSSYLPMFLLTVIEGPAPSLMPFFQRFMQS